MHPEPPATAFLLRVPHRGLAAAYRPCRPHRRVSTGGARHQQLRPQQPRAAMQRHALEPGIALHHARQLPGCATVPRPPRWSVAICPVRSRTSAPEPEPSRYGPPGCSHRPLVAVEPDPTIAGSRGRRLRRGHRRGRRRRCARPPSSRPGRSSSTSPGSGQTAFLAAFRGRVLPGGVCRPIDAGSSPAAPEDGRGTPLTSARSPPASCVDHVLGTVTDWVAAVCRIHGPGFKPAP